MDYYRILGVDFCASKSEIQKAYRNLAKKYHPDKNMSTYDDASTRFKVLKEAFDILSDDNKRRRYDSMYKRNNYDTDNSSYDVTIDDMGMSIHSMTIHNLFEMSDEFQDDLSANHL